MKLLIDVHGDDGALFAAWTIIRERPAVLVVYDSCVQSNRGVMGCGSMTRREETKEAHGELLKPASVPLFLGFQDDLTYTPKTISAAIATHMIQQLETVTDIWAPAFEEGGHEQHNIVALACNAFEGTCNVHRYLTYTRAGGKSRKGKLYDDGYHTAAEVQPPSGDAIAKKLRALACFESQMQLDSRLGTAEWFYGNDLREYVLLPAKGGETRG